MDNCPEPSGNLVKRSASLEEISDELQPETNCSELEQMDLEEVDEERRKINGQIDKMEKRLSIVPVPVAEGDEQRWLLLFGSRDPSIREVQVDARRLNKQLENLFLCIEQGRMRMQHVERVFRHQSSSLRSLKHAHEEVESFHLTKQSEASKCLQRYRYARGLYAGWRELFEIGRDLRMSFKKVLERTQSSTGYKEPRRRVLEKIAAVHEVCMSRVRLLLSRVRALEVRLEPVALSRGSHYAKRAMGSAAPSAGLASARNSAAEEPYERPHLVKFNRWQRRSIVTVQFAHGELFDLPVIVPPVSRTWYGRMRAKLHGCAAQELEDI
ncbi:hypothetical protein KR009_005198 [Drosophila setifemur]|nr:hypothetical protein KR009_005198 [Drosophila setifemur]